MANNYHGWPQQTCHKTRARIPKIGELRPRPHECVLKSLRFRFTENAMKVLRPRDRFQIVLPVHTKTMKTTENALRLLLRICRRRYLNLWAANSQSSLIGARYQIKKKQYVLCRYPPSWIFQMIVDWDWGHMTNRFQNLRFQWIRPVHTKPILWAFSKVCVFCEPFMPLK